MKRFLITSVLLTSLFISGLTADTLWQAAVELFAQNRSVHATRIQTDSAEYDGRGNQRFSRQTEIQVTTDARGIKQSRLVRLREDGREFQPTDAITSASDAATPDSADPSNEGRAAAMAVLQNSPFDPDLQPAISVTRAGTEPKYHYTLELDQRSVTGTAWLDPQDGTPLRLTATIRPLPRFVHELQVEQHFAHNSIGWHTSRASIDAEGGFLFIRRRIEITLLFLDHTSSGDQPTGEIKR